jgi:large subunit ribosomal protein L19
MNRIIEQLETLQMRSDLPEIEIGDTVRVHLRITEGEGKDRRSRIQVFEGVVIGRRGRGMNDMLTVRRVTYGIGVERTFPVHAPNIEKFEVTRKGDVRRAKLYYLRDRVGKSAKVKERSRWATKRAPKIAAPMAAAPVAEPVVTEPAAEAAPAVETEESAE